MSININASELVGKIVKDENEKEIGKVVSFLIDSSGQPQEALVETVQGHLAKYPLDLLDIKKDEVSVVSEVTKKIETLTEQIPKIRKKRNILDKLAANKVITSGIYEGLCKEFDKALKEMKNEAQTLLEAVDKQIKSQDEQLKTLQLARAFLEIEHGIGTLSEETYQQSIMTILREVKNAQQTKLSLLRTKDKIADALVEEKEEIKPEPSEEEKGEAAEASTDNKNEITTQSKEAKQITVRVTEG